MSQEFRCKKCGELIDLDEANKEHLQKLADQQKKDLEKKYNDDSREALIKELTPQLKQQADKDAHNKLKFEHGKDIEKERMKRERAEEKIIKIEEQVEKAKKPINQESPEVDGEVQERVLENYLKKRFPTDNIVPVPKGKRGADCIQEIIESNSKCGKILWESKDTETFQEKYVKKLYKDMSDNNIGFGVLAVVVLPKKLKEKFEFRENKKILLCKFDETLDVVSEMVRQYAVTVTKSKISNTKNLDKSQKDLWNLFNSDTFVIDFRNVLKASSDEYDQIESDKTASDRSYKKRIRDWQERKDNLKKIIRHFLQVEGTKITSDLIKISDDNDDEDDEK